MPVGVAPQTRHLWTKCPEVMAASQALSRLFLIPAGGRKTLTGARAPPPGPAVLTNRKGAPQVRIVLLQGLDFLRVQAVTVGMDRYLIEIVCTPPLQGNEFPDRG